jgi:hypothetical protein
MVRLNNYKPTASAGEGPAAKQIVRVRRSGRTTHGPDWRFRRAVHLMNIKAQPDAAEDALTCRLLQLLRLRGGLRPCQAPPEVWRRYPYLETALQMFMGDRVRCNVIETALNSGLDFAAIAGWTGLPASFIRVYVAFFFDHVTAAGHGAIVPEPLHAAAG